MVYGPVRTAELKGVAAFIYFSAMNGHLSDLMIISAQVLEPDNAARLV